MSTKCPYEAGVATGGFDHTSPDHAKVWKKVYGEMREKCPVAWSDHYDGYWVATRYKDVMNIAQSPSVDTAKEYDAEADRWYGGNIIPPFPSLPNIPVDTNNQEWRGYRTFLNPKFSATAVEARRPFARGFARSLVDRFIEKGSADLVEELTSPLPSLVTMQMFGFPIENWNDFSEPIHKQMWYRQDGPEWQKIVDGINGVFATVAREAEDRRQNPTDDLMSYVANGSIDGRKLTPQEVVQIATTMIFAGVDTTTALTSNVLHYLGSPEGAEDRKRLIADPALRPIARDEFLRFFSPVQHVARRANADFEMAGQKFEKGTSILLALSSANQDDATFDSPEELRIDRRPNRHVGFGVGMHLCLGKFMAQVMFDEMLNEVLERIPDYRVEPGEERYSSIDKVNGWSHLPVSFTPGKVRGDGLKI